MTTQTIQDNTGRMPSTSDLERQAAHCSQCGHSYDLSPLVNKAVDEKLGNYFGEVEDRSKKLAEEGLTPTLGFFGYVLKVVGLFAAADVIAPENKEHDLYFAAGIISIGIGLSGISRLFRKEKDSSDVLDIKDRLKAFSKKD